MDAFPTSDSKAVLITASSVMKLRKRLKSRASFRACLPDALIFINSFQVKEEPLDDDEEPPKLPVSEEAKKDDGKKDGEKKKGIPYDPERPDKVSNVNVCSKSSLERDTQDTGNSG